MKATLCVFVALVAVTSAVPTFMQSNRRGACTATGWCASACTCLTGQSDECDGTNAKYCANPGSSGVVTAKCTNLNGGTALTATCACGADTTAEPAAKIAAFSATPTASAPGFCLLSKNTGSSVATSRASTDTCPNSATTATQWNNAKTTCGDANGLNACASGHVCKIAGGTAGTCLPVCTPTTAAATGTAAPTGGCACGSDYATVAATKWCGIKADGTGIQLDKAACATAKSDGRTDNSATSDICNCGTAASALTSSTNKYCYVAANSVAGLALPNPVCTTAQSDGVTDTSSSICNCGTASAIPTTSTNKFCAIKADGVTGLVLPNSVCTTAQSDGVTDTSSSICNCGTTAATPTTSTNKYCSVTNTVGLVLPNPVCTTTQANGVTD